MLICFKCLYLPLQLTVNLCIAVLCESICIRVRDWHLSLAATSAIRLFLARLYLLFLSVLIRRCCVIFISPHQLGGDLPQALTNIALKLLSVVVFVYSYVAPLIQLLPNSQKMPMKLSDEKQTSCSLLVSSRTQLPST